MSKIKFKPKNITLREDQIAWLKQHPKINFSGFTQDRLDDLIKNHNSK